MGEQDVEQDEPLETEPKWTTLEHIPLFCADHLSLEINASSENLHEGADIQINFCCDEDGRALPFKLEFEVEGGFPADPGASYLDGSLGIFHGTNVIYKINDENTVELYWPFSSRFPRDQVGRLIIKYGGIPIRAISAVSAETLEDAVQVYHLNEVVVEEDVFELGNQSNEKGWEDSLDLGEDFNIFDFKIGCGTGELSSLYFNCLLNEELRNDPSLSVESWAYSASNQFRREWVGREMGALTGNDTGVSVYLDSRVDKAIKVEVSRSTADEGGSGIQSKTVYWFGVKDDGEGNITVSKLKIGG